MNLSAIWIRRPVMTTLVMVCLLVFGVMGFRHLPIAQLPNVDYPTIVVSASLPGASPLQMAADVALPLEKQFSQINGLTQMISQNSIGRTSITLTFDLSREIDGAALDVNTAINAANRFLPSDMPSPPSYNKSNPADRAIMYINFSSDILNMSQIYNYVDAYVVPQIATVNGVANCSVGGGGAQKPAVRIQLNPDKLASLGLSAEQVTAALDNNNVTTTGGTVYGRQQSFSILSNLPASTADDYNRMVVAVRDGVPVRLSDVGQAIDSVDNYWARVDYADRDGYKKAVNMMIYKQPGSNIVQIADDVRAKLPQIQNMLPESIAIDVMNDQSLYIKQSFHDVMITLLIAVVLVVLVVFLFVREARSTVIPAVAVPLSVIGTFAVMYLSDFSLDMMSMMAMVLAVGFVVDDAVVVTENIVRRVEMGEPVVEATFNGSREICFTVLSMTLSLVAVFLPILFMPGMIGRLFHEFAMVLASAILLSGFISLTLTPMMCRYLLRRHNRPAGSRGLYWWLEDRFNAAASLYGRSLAFMLNHKKIGLGFVAIMLVASVGLFVAAPKGFIPSEDQNFLLIFTQAADWSSYDYLHEKQLAVMDIVHNDPDTEKVVSMVQQPNSGMMVVALRDKGVRRRPLNEMLGDWRRKFANIVGLKVTVLNPPPVVTGGRPSATAGQFTMMAADFDQLTHYCQLMLDELGKNPKLTDINSDSAVKMPLLTVNFNKDKAQLLGISLRQAMQSIYAGYGPDNFSTIYGSTNQYNVWSEWLPRYEYNPETLRQIYLRAADGSAVPLTAVAEVSQSLTPIRVNHSNQLISNTVFFNPQTGYSLGEAVTAVRQTAQQKLPREISYRFDGDTATMQQSFANLGLLLFATIFVIYVILGILYESFIHPLTIFSALPLAGFGALLALGLFGKELDLYAYIGIIMLVGLVKKNGIMMIDFALELERREGLPPARSIHRACLTRFRPIMMTTMAAILGALPMALGFGAGGESRMTMGIAVVGGLVFSQLFTLYITPVFYLTFDRLNQLRGRRRPAGPAGGSACSTAGGARPERRNSGRRGRPAEEGKWR
ncbi:MAG: efflux RND transporter permease subunit [Negativicutes bacterium]|nr:efflux RND transporter permease subunit [Negativicutes bacterium]